MRRMALGALAAVMLGSAALVPQADARCWWNGYAWHCWHPHGYWWHPYYYHPYAWNWRRHSYAYHY